MEPKDKRGHKKRGVLLASAGFLLALLVALGLKLLGHIEVGYGGWFVMAAAALGVQGALWLVVHFGWDRHLPWDPHYVYVPLLGAAVVLNTFTYIAVEARALTLMGWFVALLFVAGLAGFAPVVSMTAFMAAGHALVVTLRTRGGEALPITSEAALVTAFLLIGVYAGMVYERLRREKLEMKALRQKLADLARTDALTGLPNRRHFEELLRAELDRIRRYGGECALAMLDVDDFKAYNDTHGHIAGDLVLRELAGEMQARLRSTDVLVRYGGEEFALVMVNTSKAEALEVVDRLRRDVERHAFTGEEVQPSGRLTFSAGLAGCPDEGDDYDTLVRRADAALYAAKRQGRNRVHVAEPTLEAT